MIDEKFIRLMDKVEEWIVGALRAKGMSYEPWDDAYIFINRARNTADPSAIAWVILALEDLAEANSRLTPAWFWRDSIAHTKKLAEDLRTYGYDEDITKGFPIDELKA